MCFSQVDDKKAELLDKLRVLNKQKADLEKELNAVLAGKEEIVDPEISFDAIENVPVYPGCEKKRRQKRELREREKLLN